MATTEQVQGRKWINGIIAVGAILLGYYVIAFVNQMGEWFDLEAKVSHFNGLTQGVGVLVGLGAFLFISKHATYSAFLNEVYAELTKVIWPEKNGVIKLTAGIMVALVICSMVLFVIDYLSQTLLGLLY